MPNFTKKWMPERGSWTPDWNAPSAEQEDAVIEAIWSLGSRPLEFLAALGGVRVKSMRPNRTGRKIDVRIQFDGRSVKTSLFPAEGRRKRRRTRTSIIREVGLHLMRKFGDPSFYASVTGAARQRSKDGGILILNSSYVDPVLADFVSAGFEAGFQTVDSEGLDELVDGVVAMADGGEVDAAFDRHQGGRALEQFKEMAVHSLGHGIRIEDLHSALDEALVKVTMES